MFNFTKNKTEFTLEEVNEILSNIATPLSLYLVPENLEEERAKFFKEDDYNPVFKYRKAEKDNMEQLKILDNLRVVSDVDPAISNIILQIVESKKQTSELLESIGDDERFVKISYERFKLPSYKLFRKACRVLRRRYGDINIVESDKKLRQRKLRYDDLVVVFQKVFEILDLTDWEVDKSKAIVSSGIRTVAKTKRVMLDPNIDTNVEKIRKTIVHEILTHVLRSSNGFATGIESFGKPTVADYLDDEEGLATYNEEKFGLLRAIDIKKRAAFVYAIYLAQYSSFRQIFDALRSIYARRSAFEITYRVKRGMSDTSLTGCYCKDVSYFRGFLNIRRKLSGDENGYKYMYAGKIAYSWIPLVEEGIIPKPSVYPTQHLVDRIFSETGLV
ncbi:DUF1704 domain-containing protein [Candidatus Dojkabacteria bacterium]|nr:DUF1704 domain-containing protein [Candidatus Dojkabacteria bacterium]